MIFNGDMRCDSCGYRRLATQLIDFQDGGQVFGVCDECAEAAADRGCLVLALSSSDTEAS